MSGGDHNWKSKVVLLHGLKNDSGKLSSFKGAYLAKRHTWFRKHVRSIACMFVLMGFFFFLDSLMVSIFDLMNLHNTSTSKNSKGLKVGLCVLLYCKHFLVPVLYCKHSLMVSRTSLLGTWGLVL